MNQLIQFTHIVLLAACIGFVSPIQAAEPVNEATKCSNDCETEFANCYDSCPEGKRYTHTCHSRCRKQKSNCGLRCTKVGRNR